MGLISQASCLPATTLYFRVNYSEMGPSLVAQIVKNLPAIQETQVQSLGWECPLEKGILVWRIPRTEEFHEQSMGLQRVFHDMTNTFISLHKGPTKI